MNFENLIINQTDYIVFALDPDSNFIALNAAAEKLFGNNADTLVGKPFNTVLDPYSHEKADRMITLTFELESVRDWELDHFQVDHEPVLVGYSTCLLKDKNGNLVGIGAVGRDLSVKMELTAQLAATNQKLEGALLQLEKAHQELKETQAQLLQSEKMRALGQMVAGVAHEINNPLGFIGNNNTFIKSKIAVLQSLVQQYTKLKESQDPALLVSINNLEKQSGVGYLWDDLTDAIDENQDGIQRIQQIVLSLRNFSRLDESILKEVDLNEGLQSTINLVAPMCKGKIKVNEEYGNLPKISCHPGEINQVFLNLLTNSIQSIENEGTISVSSNYLDDLITIIIKDSGHGMDQDTILKLGEPFFTTKPIGSGVGLGLAVSYGIINRHNGNIFFESTPGKGTTATIELPLIDRKEKP